RRLRGCCLSRRLVISPVGAARVVREPSHGIRRRAEPVDWTSGNRVGLAIPPTQRGSTLVGSRLTSRSPVCSYGGTISRDEVPTDGLPVRGLYWCRDGH